MNVSSTRPARLEFAFRVTTRNRDAPLDLAAESEDDFLRWKTAFENKVLCGAPLAGRWP